MYPVCSPMHPAGTPTCPQVLQDFLCQQPGQLSHVDLVTDVYEFLEQLEPAANETNLQMVQASVDTLTEFVQGNLSRISTNVLLQTKLLDVLNRLVQKGASQLGDAVPPSEVNRLRSGSMGKAVLCSA